jgi:serine/threonine protein kinase
MAEMKKGLVINDRFEVDMHIGDGGYGSVWKGEDKQLERPVAIKRLKRRCGGEDLRDEVIEEARRISRIMNQNIVSIFDVIAHGDEWLIVMEFMAHGSLHGYLRDLSLQGNWISVAEAFRILRGILNGLAAAHGSDRGAIIHRDLKPENVLFDSSMQPKIADFGLAAIGTVEKLSTAVRHIGHEGTEFYMSPEQLQGDALDVRSDLFNVGLISYLLLGGAHPFVDPRNLFSFREMIVTPYRNLPPIKTSVLPIEVENFVFSLLNSDPTKRFESALGVLDELTEAENAYHKTFLETILEYHDSLKTGEPRATLSNEELAVGVQLCKRNRFFSQGAYLYESSGVDFSALRNNIREQLETDYQFCRRRAQQEVTE